MTYTGHFRGGVVVLEGSSRFEYGTVVRVEVESTDRDGRRGSLDAVLKSAGAWASSSDEVDRLLGDIHQMKRDELHSQQSIADTDL